MEPIMEKVQCIRTITLPSLLFELSPFFDFHFDFFVQAVTSNFIKVIKLELHTLIENILWRSAVHKNHNSSILTFLLIVLF